MKPTQMALAVLASGVMFATSARAIPYVDFNPIGVKLDDANPSYLGEFNIVDVGYNPATQRVTSATAWFAFADDVLPWDGLADPLDLYGNNEVVKVDLGLVNGYFGPVEVDLATVLGGNVEGSVLLDLSSDGVLSYKINKVAGDFYIGFAKLVAEASPRTANAVPDGGTTAVLLGLALLGLSAARRKMRS